MSDRLLRRADIAAMLNTSQGVAATILAQNGVHPIDWGVGSGRGPRWLESAVLAALRAMNAAAQPKPKRDKKASKSSIPRASIADLHVNELHSILTQGQCVQ